MIVRDGTYADIRELARYARRIAIFAQQRLAVLQPTEAPAVASELQVATDSAMELFYMLSDTLDNLETEE